MFILENQYINMKGYHDAMACLLADCNWVSNEEFYYPTDNFIFCSDKKVLIKWFN